MDFIADQLIGLFAGHFYSTLTSPPTSWLGCSALVSSPTNWSDCSSLHRQPRWGLASYAGDSYVFGFFMQELLAKQGTPLVVGSRCFPSVCYQAAPCCSDQGADLGQHVWGLDTRMSDDVGKLLDFFSLTLLQDSFFIFQQARGTKWLHFT